VFFNVFSDPEPFAAIQIAHGTHDFYWGGLLRPKGPKLETEGREWWGFLGGGSEPLPTSYGCWGSTKSSSFWTY